MSATEFAGHSWVFGDNMDTDLMLPGPFLWATPEKRATVVFQANRPGWTELVQPGDALIAGANFGIGSSRPAALSIRMCGIGFVLAESINGLFLRTAMNFGLPAFEAPGITGIVEEGQRVAMSITEWTATNLDTGATVAVTPMAELPLSIMLGGGVIELLESRGLIAKRDPEPAR